MIVSNEQSANSIAAEMQKEFDNADQQTKITMAFALALRKIFFSDLNEDIRADALRASILYYRAACEANTIDRIAKLRTNDKLPMDVAVMHVAKIAMELEEEYLGKFRNIMELFDFKV